MTPLEKVARALAQLHYFKRNDVHPEDIDALVADNWPKWLREARTAIQAFEPSEAMLDAAHACTASRLNILGSGLTVAFEKAKLRFIAMREAALEEKVE